MIEKELDEKYNKPMFLNPNGHLDPKITKDLLSSCKRSRQPFSSSLSIKSFQRVVIPKKIYQKAHQFYRNLLESESSDRSGASLSRLTMKNDEKTDINIPLFRDLCLKKTKQEEWLQNINKNSNLNLRKKNLKIPMKKAINFLKNLKDLNTNQIACDRSNNVTKIIPHLFPKQVRSSSVFSQRGPPRPRKNSIKINLLAKSPGPPLPPQEPRRSVKTMVKASTARISPKRWVAENPKKFLEVPRPSELRDPLSLKSNNFVKTNLKTAIEQVHEAYCRNNRDLKVRNNNYLQEFTI
ncbi:unnamed protein product [Moneuplotes crassus]|uniref:Uncharacterized protein n=1 Tax=Euplotes crassus TaxID=5936 RepID=A0AAD1X9D9_EUPCR|nr:unnamed protein product [Moneuplotes crassus]